MKQRCSPRQAVLGIVNLGLSWPTNLSDQFADGQLGRRCSFP